MLLVSVTPRTWICVNVFFSFVVVVVVVVVVKGGRVQIFGNDVNRTKFYSERN